ncbi:MAG: glycosyl hydrolase, partial [Ktedonobacterales bacterium]|nr:glycosyl hydrolase [Ktedonobacterales bacterium]
WSSIYNQPTAEFYHVTTDTRTPYRVYGAQQDNSTISVPSRSAHGAILPADYAEVGGGESGYIAVRPDDPDIIYAGSYQGYISRYDQRTGQRRDITVWPEAMIGWPAREARYRFQWTFPLLLSPHDPNILYTAGNRVFRSTDEGGRWEAISPDLTRSDESRLGDSGGPITLDNCGTEYYATIFALAESPLVRGLFWSGSDDGLAHVSRDGGESWQNVTPVELPEWALISFIEPSPHDPAVAYLAATRYKLDDFTPYLFKTADHGQHWMAISAGLPSDVFARVIREDPARRGLLYAGTEAGLFVSFDDGAHWQSLRLNLPVVPIHDLVIKGSDLIAATHGRSLWILDDLTPLHQLTEEVRAAAAHLFAPRLALRFAGDGGYGAPPVPGMTNYQHAGAWVVGYREVTRPDGEKERDYLDAGRNPHDGVYLTYYLREQPAGDITLTFLDAAGHEIQTFSSAERKQEIAIAGDLRSTTEEPKREKPEARLPKAVGLNRFCWDMRYPAGRPVNGYVTTSGVVAGPLALPGRYQARLTVGEETVTQPFEIALDPRVATPHADLEAQFALLLAIRDMLSQVHEAADSIQNIRYQLEEWERRAEGQSGREELANNCAALKERLSGIEEELIATRAREDDDTLRFPVKLNFKLAALFDVVASAESAPTQQARAVFAELAARVEARLAQVRRVFEEDVAAFNALVRESGVPALAPGVRQAPSRAPSFAG